MVIPKSPFPPPGIITYFCPCYTFGKNAEAVGDSCFLCGLSFLIPPINLYTLTHVRGKVRDQKGIEVRVQRGIGQRVSHIGSRDFTIIVMLCHVPLALNVALDLVSRPLDINPL